MSILTGQAKTLRTHVIFWAVAFPLTLTAIPRGFEAEVFTGPDALPVPNQQCQSTEEEEIEIPVRANMSCIMPLYVQLDLLRH